LHLQLGNLFFGAGRFNKARQYMYLVSGSSSFSQTTNPKTTSDRVIRWKTFRQTDLIANLKELLERLDAATYQENNARHC
jgi:hypothetical protein